jgi:hypothetical protein
MSQFNTRMSGDTLVALQKQQLAMEAQTKMSAKDAATKVVEHHSKKHGWTEEEMATVMGALGLA